MKIPLITIGNSRGVRIPKTMLEQVGFEEEVELSVYKNNLLLSPVKQDREGWAEAFNTMAAQGDDQLIIASHPSEWDELEWQW